MSMRWAPTSSRRRRRTDRREPRHEARYCRQERREHDAGRAAVDRKSPVTNAMTPVSEPGVAKPASRSSEQIEAAVFSSSATSTLTPLSIRMAIPRHAPNRLIVIGDAQRCQHCRAVKPPCRCWPRGMHASQNADDRRDRHRVHGREARTRAVLLSASACETLLEQTRAAEQRVTGEGDDRVGK